MTTKPHVIQFRLRILDNFLGGRFAFDLFLRWLAPFIIGRIHRGGPLGREEGEGLLTGNLVSKREFPHKNPLLWGTWRKGPCLNQPYNKSRSYLSSSASSSSGGNSSLSPSSYSSSISTSPTSTFIIVSNDVFFALREEGLFFFLRFFQRFNAVPSAASK